MSGCKLIQPTRKSGSDFTSELACWQTSGCDLIRFICSNRACCACSLSNHGEECQVTPQSSDLFPVGVVMQNTSERERSSATWMQKDADCQAHSRQWKDTVPRTEDRGHSTTRLAWPRNGNPGFEREHDASLVKRLQRVWNADHRCLSVHPHCVRCAFPDIRR